MLRSHHRCTTFIKLNDSSIYLIEDKNVNIFFNDLFHAAGGAEFKYITLAFLNFYTFNMNSKK